MNIKTLEKEYIVQCLGCKLIHRLSGNELTFDKVSSDERQMGVENCHQAEIEITCDCGQDFTVEVVCWEYPVGALNNVDISVSNCVIVVDPEFNFIHESPKNEGDE